MNLAKKVMKAHGINEKQLPKKLPSKAEIKSALEATKDVKGMDRISALEDESKLIKDLLGFWTVPTLEAIADGSEFHLTTDRHTPKGKKNLAFTKGKGTTLVFEGSEKEIADLVKKLEIKLKK